MRSLPLIAALFPVLLAAACSPSSGGDRAAPAESSTPTPAAGEGAAATPSPVENGAADAPNYTPPELTPEAEKGEKGARNVLLSFAQALEDKAFAPAYALYGPDGAPGLREADFAAGFARYRTIDVAFGDGDPEGAAGSIYYQVPLTVSGKAEDGSAYQRKGTITLRRVNDVPGAEPWKLKWHIARIDWQDGANAS